jgi:aspartate-semialdehyde dehydrogenase
MKRYRVAVTGATGLVGRTMTTVLEERQFPVSELRLLASDRSVGSTFRFGGEEIQVQPLEQMEWSEVDLALFAVKAGIASRIAPRAAEAGCVVVDNSTAYRMDPEVPLVVPEVNPERVRDHQGIIANPNCSTIQLVVVLAPLNRVARIERVVLSTYQSVSGAGHAAVDALLDETRMLLDRTTGGTASRTPFPHPIAGNLIPQIDRFDPGGDTLEELKVIRETRKIMGLPDLKITATAVRVPVLYAHSESVNITFERTVSPDECHDILSNAPGIVVLDDPENAVYPMPLTAAGKDEVFVGRIRRDPSSETSLNLWIVADNLRKGAATNAVQIAEVWAHDQT